MPDTKAIPLSPSLKDAVKEDKSFVHFDARLAPDEKAAFATLCINATSSYDNFGAIDLVKPEAEKFFLRLGNSPGDAARAAATVDRLAREALEAFGAEAGWLTIRAALPTGAFDIPRWHQDGTFFDTPTGEQRKVAIALKGASTLFNDLPNALRGKFQEALRAEKDSTEQRLKIAQLVNPSDNSTGAEGQGSIFISGTERAAVHSEPPIHAPRVFVSIVPGTAAQIEELRTRWERPVTTYSAAAVAKPPSPQ